MHLTHSLDYYNTVCRQDGFFDKLFQLLTSATSTKFGTALDNGMILVYLFPPVIGT